MVQRSPFINRPDVVYSSLPKRDKPASSSNDYAVINHNPSHQRFKSYDSGSHSNTKAERNDLSHVENTLYAQIRKPPLTGTVSNPAQV